jgi:hypothetical protein
LSVAFSPLQTPHGKLIHLRTEDHLTDLRHFRIVTVFFAKHVTLSYPLPLRIWEELSRMANREMERGSTPKLLLACDRPQGGLCDRNPMYDRRRLLVSQIPLLQL